MKVAKINIHPYIRLLLLVGIIASVILYRHIFQLGLLYIAFIIPLILLMGIIRNHVRLLLFGIVPIAFTFILIYILILSGNKENWDFILVKILKILAVTSIFQIVLTFESGALYPTFGKLGLKGESLITVIGAFTVWADIKRRSEQIIIARFARGFIGKRNFINTAKQFPYILVPLIIGILRTSIERSETWIRWNIINLISTKRAKYEEYSVTVNVAIALITVLCLTIGIIYP
jgi:hypothetical protein